MDAPARELMAASAAASKQKPVVGIHEPRCDRLRKPWMEGAPSYSGKISLMRVGQWQVTSLCDLLAVCPMAGGFVIIRSFGAEGGMGIMLEVRKASWTVSRQSRPSKADSSCRLLLVSVNVKG